MFVKPLFCVGILCRCLLCRSVFFAFLGVEDRFYKGYSVCAAFGITWMKNLSSISWVVGLVQ